MGATSGMFPLHALLMYIYIIYIYIIYYILTMDATSALREGLELLDEMNRDCVPPSICFFERLLAVVARYI